MTNKPKMLIDLNTSDEKTLINELRIPSRLAKRILAFRPYQSVDQLSQVWGIDPEILARIRTLVTVQSVQAVSPTEKDANHAASLSEGDHLSTEAGNLPEISTDQAAVQVRPQEEPVRAQKATKGSWKTNLILILILLAGAYFRFVGINWDQNQHQQPDERFITMVAEQIRGVGGIGQYFDTASSTLNPLNYGSYTYGMLPLFVTRMVAEWRNMTEYNQITLVGRAMSGLFDLAAIWLLYLLGKKLYNQRIGILAAALYAAAVLPIQLSHFFAVDTFSTVFVISAFYFALLAIPLEKPEPVIDRGNLRYFALFGFIVGLAGACKVNVIPVFGVIILAGIARLTIGHKRSGFRSLLWIMLAGWALAALTAVAGFRIFQPYAFAGPGLFGLALNQRWLEVIREVTNQVAGLSEWPPNHHWTNRPFSYAGVNIATWGLGLSLGLAGLAGLVWAGWRIWKGEWRSHLLPFVWVLGYFFWINIQFWRYMRYFLPIYPFVILFAAWALIELYDRTRESREKLVAAGRNLRVQSAQIRSTWMGLAGILAVAIVLLGTYGYAFAFTRIYTRPITRITASRWMLENIPGPLNLLVESSKGSKSYPVSIANQWVVEPGRTDQTDIRITTTGTSSQITSTNIRQIGVYFYIRLSRDGEGKDIITEGRLAVPDDSHDDHLSIRFGDVYLDPDQTVYLYYKISNSSQYSFSDTSFRNEEQEGLSIPLDFNLQNASPGTTEGTISFQSGGSYRINRFEINQFSQAFIPAQAKIKLSLLQDGDDQNPLAVSEADLDFPQPGTQLSPTFTFAPVDLVKGKTYQVRYQVVSGGPVRIMGETYTLETSWDDALPLSVDRYDPLGGIYKPFNLELYEPDTPEKRESMLKILADSEFIVIPSNRAYDAMPRLPLRYPLTLKYYQTLFGCNCSGDALEYRAYALEAPFTSPLGFTLVATFESNPNIGPFSIRDQSADESFTVYDHPKVMIFKKNVDFSIDKVREILESVDLDQVIFQGPLSYTRAPTALQLPQDRLAAQTAGGTWSSMFSWTTLINSNQTLAVVFWYLFLLLLGWAVFPLVFTAFSGLPDRGYPLARMAGLIIVAWLSWMLGSLKILQFTQLTIWLCILLVLIISGWLAYSKRQAMLDHLRAQWKHILATEFIFLLLFLVFLFIRLGNPDLWQPWMGGEKPMDFAFFNATLKSAYFPPENPWFSGHYINYYYYGYVIAAIPTKILGIVPSIAFNLILPAWFAMAGLGVFCVGFNLVAGLFKSSRTNSQDSLIEGSSANLNNTFSYRWAYGAGIIALMAVMFFGNLYMSCQFWKYLPDVAPAEVTDNLPNDRLGAVLAGAKEVLSGQTELPGDNARWYFEASRPILHDGPDTPIAEFPFFSFLYADMHPHLLTMPVYGLALGWVASLLLLPLGKMKRRDQAVSLILAGLIFGVFRASHTWDFPVFLALGALIIAWNVWQTRTGTPRHIIAVLFGYELAFVGLAVAFYYPFSQWFKTEYVSLELWKGARTPLVDYLFVFGLSLFVMITLMVRDLQTETRNAYRWWTATNFKKHIPAYLILVASAIGMVLLWNFHYQVLILGIPLLVGIAYLIFFKRGISTFERVIWFLFGMGIAITLLVEVVVLKGDVGRANMVFRMYLEAWFIFGIAISAALVELLTKMAAWRLWLKIAWGSVLGILVLIAVSYSLVATPKKIADRWPDIQEVANTLDGAAYMQGDASPENGQAPTIYNDEGRPINITMDNGAIKFMQENIKGSPVIVEGHTEEYRWGSRYSIYTGLPSVIGWSWHTRQHNSLIDGSVIDKRINEVNDFYNTPDTGIAKQFLDRYHVQYIIVSSLERVYYSAEGLDKFKGMANDGYLRIVYGDNSPQSATIFEVVNPN